jgi:CheY-like chemotaxis protein
MSGPDWRHKRTPGFSKMFAYLRAEDSMMKRALIVEDQIPEIQRAINLLRDLGIEEIDSFSRVDSALLRLEEAVEGKHAIPDLIILDLNFNTESGFEILRFWKSNKLLHDNTCVVVWTEMTNPEQELARCFGAEVVPKWTGPAELETAVKRCSAVQRAS